MDKCAHLENHSGVPASATQAYKIARMGQEWSDEPPHKSKSCCTLNQFFILSVKVVLEIAS